MKRISEVSKSKLAIYHFSGYFLTALFVAIYLLAFRWNPIFAIPMVVLFAYCVYSPSKLIVNFIAYLGSSPLILKEREDIARDGIPSDVKVVFFRPIFAKTPQEVETLINNMELDIVNNQEPVRNLKFIVIDNTRDELVKQRARDMIRELQGKFGEGMVFYFHRNPKCDFFKKLGIYQDAIMLLYEGWTRPNHYTGRRWQEWAKGTRDPKEPIFDEVLGDIKALGIDGEVDDILKGGKVNVKQDERIKVAIVCDADNVWSKGSIRKMVAKIMHPENSEIVIFQPSIRISNPDVNRYVKLAVLARRMYGFDPLVRWRIYHFSPFYGKGAMRVDSYVRDIIKAEALHPGRAASHDFQEALEAWTVLIEDVHINENTFSNKLSELLRDAQWLWGDMETVRQFLLKDFAPGRKSHLYVLLRRLVGDLVFGVWVVGSIVGWLVPGLMELTRPRLLLALVSGVGVCLVLVPRFIAPFVSSLKERKEALILPAKARRSIFGTLAEGLLHVITSTLVHKLDLLYRPPANVRNYINQVRGKPFVWKTGAMGEIATAEMGMWQIYRSLLFAPLMGLILVIAGVFRILPPLLFLLLSPLIASFIFGPTLIWFLSRSKS